jgi:hypothetical protein
MPVVKIQEIISQAKAHEEKTNNLHKLVSSHLDDIHHSIEITDKDEVNALYNFAQAYIEHVPTFITELRDNAEKMGISTAIEKIVSVAEEFFIHPPTEITADHIGMDAILDEAYLAHRLMEELNDVFLLHHGLLLIPQDMITANLIIHAMIGDPFAGDLDELVINMIEPLAEALNDDALKALLLTAKANQCDSLLDNLDEKWPCLSRDHGIILGSQQTATI